MGLDNISYSDLLKHIDNLRDQGLSDNHPDMLQAKWKLLDFLHSQKHGTPKSSVPRVNTTKTFALVEKKEPSKLPGYLAAAALMVLGLRYISRKYES